MPTLAPSGEHGLTTVTEHAELVESRLGTQVGAGVPAVKVEHTVVVAAAGFCVAAAKFPGFAVVRAPVADSPAEAPGTTFAASAAAAVAADAAGLASVARAALASAPAAARDDAAGGDEKKAQRRCCPDVPVPSTSGATEAQHGQRLPLENCLRVVVAHEAQQLTPHRHHHRR